MSRDRNTPTSVLTWFATTWNYVTHELFFEQNTKLRFLIEMKNDKLSYWWRIKQYEKDKSWKTSKQVRNTRVRRCSHALFNLTFTIHSFFANHANICCSISAVFARGRFSFFRCWSTLCNGSFVGFRLECHPRQIFVSSLWQHFAAYAGIDSVLINNPAIHKCHVY